MTTPSLPVLDPTAAAVDVGSEQLHVSIAGGQPKVFGTMTGDLHQLRDWLKAQGVRSVAMEATGIYWLCPYEVLEKAGLQVVVVNGKYVKNLPGRKTDMKDLAGDPACARAAQAGLRSTGAHSSAAGLPAGAHRPHHDGCQS